MKKGGMAAYGGLVLRSNRLSNEPLLRARMDELAQGGFAPEMIEACLHALSLETGFPVADLRTLLEVCDCWRAAHAARLTALAA